MSTIYLAGGCFWGAEKYLALIPGVEATQVGFANGGSAAPSYQDVCAGSGHAETVKVDYDGCVIELGDLLFLFFQIIDPTSVNKQGHDEGVQYRTGVYWVDPSDESAVRQALTELQARHSNPLAVEAGLLQEYYPAEEYHQKYLDKNPDGYCHVPQTSFEKVRQQAAHVKQLRALSSEEFAVTQQDDTEPPFDNPLYDHFEPGIYVDIVSGQPLFVSSDKFESGCGWPAFSKPISDTLLTRLDDHKIPGRDRIEVRSVLANSHLGHVFTDGPAELGGLRYCINSASLRFVPVAQMADEGFADLIALVERESA
jgi:peptide methionine sulfoxide reductase msrA/msrB